MKEQMFYSDFDIMEFRGCTIDSYLCFYTWPVIKDVKVQICDVIATSSNNICHQASMRLSFKKMMDINPVEVMEYISDQIRREMAVPINISTWVLVTEDYNFNTQLIFELVILEDANLPFVRTGMYILVSRESQKYNVFYLPKEI